jgi:hypothetical protein
LLAPSSARLASRLPAALVLAVTTALITW